MPLFLQGWKIHNAQLLAQSMPFSPEVVNNKGRFWHEVVIIIIIIINNSVFRLYRIKINIQVYFRISEA
jgi:hypothetical protein